MCAGVADLNSDLAVWVEDSFVDNPHDMEFSHRHGEQTGRKEVWVIQIWKEENRITNTQGVVSLECLKR